MTSEWASIIVAVVWAFTVYVCVDKIVDNVDNWVRFVIRYLKGEDHPL